MNNLRRHALIRAAVVLGLVLLQAGVATSAQDGQNLQPGRQAPDFRYRSSSGQIVSLSSLRGKVVLLDFWATWCGWCQKATPTVEGLYGSYHGQGLEVIGFSCDDAKSVAQVPAFIQQFGITYPIVTSTDANEYTAGLYKVTCFPTQLLIDKQGVVRWRSDGYREAEDATLRQLIPSLLKAR